MVRRNIVENMPDPLCPLFDELYLEGMPMWEAAPPFRDSGKSPMVGGGPALMSLNGYGYMRMDYPHVFEDRRVIWSSDRVPSASDQEQLDMALMVADLSGEEQQALRIFAATQQVDDLALQVTMPLPLRENPIFRFRAKTDINDRYVDEWHTVTRPRLVGIKEKWAKLDLDSAADAHLLAGIREMSYEEGYYWCSNSYLGSGTALPRLGQLAAERRELREARKRHRPPAVVPAEAMQNKQIAPMREAQILDNDDSSDTMRGYAVSSGRVTARASVVRGPADFDKMEPGSILVSPLTTPAWTQLFAAAAGLVTDMGSILSHGSIVAREYGIRRCSASATAPTASSTVS